MAENTDSSVGCIVGIGVTLLLAVIGIGGGGAYYLHYKKTKAEEAARDEARKAAAEERAKRDAELAMDSGVATPPPLVFDAGLIAPPVFGATFPPVGSSPVLGPSDALVTVIEFSDFQCPYCSKVQPTLETLRKDYPADVRIVWKNMPLAFHKDAEPAAEMALEVKAELGNSGFWKAHDALFGDQTRMSPADLQLKGVALGANAVKISDAIATHKFKAVIDADASLAAAFKVSGTPSFFINGQPLTGAQPYPAFKKVVDEELAKARVLVASGTPRAMVYDKLSMGK